MNNIYIVYNIIIFNYYKCKYKILLLSINNIIMAYFNSNKHKNMRTINVYLP